MRATLHGDETTTEKERKGGAATGGGGSDQAYAIAYSMQERGELPKAQTGIPNKPVATRQDSINLLENSLLNFQIQALKG